jgi:hypothetical protein
MCYPAEHANLNKWDFRRTVDFYQQLASGICIDHNVLRAMHDIIQPAYRGNPPTYRLAPDGQPPGTAAPTLDTQGQER